MVRKIKAEQNRSAAPRRRTVAVLTAVIIALCCAALFLFAFPALFHTTSDPGTLLPAAPTQQSAPSEQPSASPSATVSPTPSPAPVSATVLLTGDLMCLYGQQSAAKNGALYDFTPSFQYVSELFSRADYVAGNLETTVNDAQPYTAPSQSAAAPAPEDGSVPVPTPRVLPVLNAPDAYLDALQKAGYDFVSTVNNHCCDTGAEGIEKTLAALDAHGIAHTGTFSMRNTSRFVLADVNGIKIAFLAYSEFFNGKDSMLTEEQREWMIGRFSEERVRQDTAAARAAGAEFVIAYTHWGDENQPEPNKTQTEHAQIFADAGVDVIAGSHPHCLQKAEVITAADGRDVLCLYSLGNFVSSMAQQAHNDTVIVSLTLVREGGGVHLSSADYIPCKVFSSREDDPFVIVPAVVGSTDDALASARERIIERMGEAIPAASA